MRYANIRDFVDHLHHAPEGLYMRHGDTWDLCTRDLKPTWVLYLDSVQLSAPCDFQFFFGLAIHGRCMLGTGMLDDDDEIRTLIHSIGAVYIAHTPPSIWRRLWWALNKPRRIR